MPGNTPLNCLICGGISYGYHFGILACRACAAFFRRTVAENKTYKCRSNLECTVAKADGLRNMCRACRYRKCEEFGMDKNDVQMNRDPIGKKEKQGGNSPESPSSTPSSSSAVITVVEQTSDKKIYSTSNPPISIIPYTNLSQLNTLERMKQGYNIYRTSQKSLYKVLYPGDIFSEEIHQIVSHNEFVKMERGCISLLFSMLNDFYLPFNELDRATKILIFQNYNMRFNLLNGAFASYQKGPALPETVFQLHYGQYMDYDNLEIFFADMMTRNQETTMQVHANIKKTRRMFNRLKVDETEIAAVAGIMLWNEASLLLPDFEAAEKAKQQIFQELHGYLITVHGGGTVGMRIGNLMLCLNDLSNGAQAIGEHRTMEKIFNPGIVDLLLDELPNG